MPTIKHRQRNIYFTWDNPYLPWKEQENPYPDPTVVSAEVRKTKVDSDGWRPMTPWTKLITYGGNYIWAEGTFFCDPIGGDFRTENENSPVLGFTLPIWSTWPSEANVKNAALSKMKDQSVNLAMLLKDRRETVQGITNRLNSLLRSVRYARRGELVKSARALRKWWRSRTPGIVNKYRALNSKSGKPLGRMWLELNFLHLQAINDVNGLIKELSRDPAVGFIHARSGLSTETTDTIRAGGYSWSYYGYLTATIKRERVIYAQISALPYLESLTCASRMGITNPLYVAWDSVPLSFIVDWVLPVGQYLNGFDALLGMKFKGAHIGTIERSQVMSTSLEAPHGYTTSGNPRIKVLLGKSFKRTLVDQFPALPEIRNPLAGLAWKAATVAALLASAVREPQRIAR